MMNDLRQQLKEQEMKYETKLRNIEVKHSEQLYQQ
jgi:uncharacterized membrane protein